MDVPNLDIAGEPAARSARFSTRSLAVVVPRRGQAVEF
jgi:hypothetical protein